MPVRLLPRMMSWPRQSITGGAADIGSPAPAFIAAPIAGTAVTAVTTFHSYPYYSSGYSYPYYSSSYSYPYATSYPYASYGYSYPYGAYAYRGIRRGYYR